MARRGQVGTIAISGKWYVVRFWKYPPGKDRIHASERVCPVTGDGALPKGERRRRANQIVAASGVNDPQKFIETTNGVTFRVQASWFLNHAMNRKRKQAAEEIGVGFVVPAYEEKPLRPMRPRKSEERTVGIAA